MLKPKFDISDLFNLSGSEIFNPDEFTATPNVSIDSRQIKKGAIFVAIRGNKFDGHKFVNDAINNGAGAIVISQRKLKDFDKVDLPIITVPNPIIAYGELAKIWRYKLGAKVVSITGSNGKTTTKDMLTTILSEKYSVVKTEANNNNHIGVPLTILSAKAGTEILVLEHGTNHFGEIEYTANIANPDISLITNIGDSHLEFLGNREGVLKEKSSLFYATIVNGGSILINNDDKFLKNYEKKSSNRITYGLKGKASVKGKIIGYDELGRSKVLITSRKYTIELTLPVIGESNVKNLLAAVTLAQQLNIPKTQIQKSVKKIKATPGRLNMSEYKSTILIDDSYNANPPSLEIAIKALRKIKKYNQALIVLGDMFELGKNSKKIHKDLSEMFVGIKNITVFTIGELMNGLHKELKKNKIDAQHFKLRSGLNEELKKMNLDKTKILVKGSRGMKMEEFIETIKSKVN
jgi:UDP-N-acetylmuramoyl-tripeptide--D-alanyl-D-alanine ligase